MHEIEDAGAAAARMPVAAGSDRRVAAVGAVNERLMVGANFWARPNIVLLSRDDSELRLLSRLLVSLQ